MKKFKKYQASAKTGFNVEKVFTELTTLVLNKIEKGEIDLNCGYGVKKGKSSQNNKLHNIGS